MSLKKKKKLFKEKPLPPRNIIIHIKDEIITDDSHSDLFQLTDTKFTKLIDVLRKSEIKKSRRLIEIKHVNLIRKKEKIASTHKYFYPLRSLINYWVIEDVSKTAAPELIKKLRGDEFKSLLDGVYGKESTTETSLHSSAGDNDRISEQFYLNGASVGVDAYYAWENDFDGAGITLGILEAGWNIDHEDLPEKIELTSGVNQYDPDARWSDDPAYAAENIIFGEGDHGTKTLGIISAVDNTKGIIGIAPGIESIKLFSKYDAAGNEKFEDAFTSAVINLNEGDIFLIEEQIGFDGSGSPLEAKSASESGIADSYILFDFIRLLSALGICVIEPAGNGNTGYGTDHDMDTASSGRLDATIPVYDSGAIMVAASFYEDGFSTAHERLDNNLNSEGKNIGIYTNYGSRVNCFAPGYRIISCGFGRTVIMPDGTEMETLDVAGSDTMTYDEKKTLDPNVQYGEHYSTSAASAIIAGVAVVVQSAYKATFGTVMSPMQMRDVLSDPDYGTWSANATAADPLVDKIGVMPDLSKLLVAIGAAPDIFIRDNLSDIGKVPTDNPLWNSPDIISRQSESIDPITDFLAAGNLASEMLCESILENTDNYIYVRVWNRSAVDAEDITVNVYYSKPALLIAPGDWVEIGSANMPTVAAESVAVSPPIPWTSDKIPSSGHYCFIAICDCAKDPKPVLPTTLLDFHRFVRNNNNVAWNNFFVDPMPSLAIQKELIFYIRGTTIDPFAVYDIIINNPSAVLLKAKVSAEFAVKHLSGFIPNDGNTDDKGCIRFQFPQQTKISIAEVNFANMAEVEMSLIITGSAEMDLMKEIRIEVSQYHKKKVVGGLTWVLQKRGNTEESN